VCLITLTKNWHEFEIASSLQNLVMVLRPGYKGANFDCLAPRPECGAGGVVRGLGEGAKAGAPAFHLTRKEWRPQQGRHSHYGETCLFTSQSASVRRSYRP